MSLLWVLAAAAVCGTSGLPALILGRTSDRGQLLAAILSAAGSAMGLLGVAMFLLGDGAPALALSWSIPGGSFSVALDGLGALFLVPVFLVSGLGAVYGLGYWRQSENPGNGRKLRVFYGLLAGSMALLLTARSSVLFLMAWEVMALAAYFLVATDDRQPSVRQAAWVYLVATHVGTMGLLALFSLMRVAAGSFEWGPIAEGAIGPGMASTIFFLALLGFGLKAGIMPFHVWLPSAHASAPSHVSGLLSGVMIKMGVYGIIRVCGYLPHPPLWWGALLIVLGAVSGVVGVASAIGQRDMKRMLAYSSIENIGIITLGIGLALMGRALGVREWVALGLGGALLHVLNHSLFKPLLFFCAGSVIHSTHTREMDLLGGLAKPMPITFLGFAAGAGAICGLPIFNGFMSELLLYLGLFKAALADSLVPRLLGAMAASGLALIGALAVACFVRALGAIFLGTGRTDRTAHATEAPASMTGVLVILLASCLVLGLAPLCAAPLLDRALGAWPGGSSVKISELAPLGTAGLFALGLAALIGLGGWFLRFRSGPLKARAAAPGTASIGMATLGAASMGTWDCGYADPSSPRIQYTASSLGEMLTGLFRWAVRLKEKQPRPSGAFPLGDQYTSEVTEPILDSCLNPFFHRWADRFSRLRILQRGNVQIYLVYILVTLVLVVAWAMLQLRGRAMSEWMVLAAIIMAGAGGLPGLCLPRGSNAGQTIATFSSVAASVLGICAAMRVFLLGPGPGISLPLAIPGAEIAIAVDALSAAFLLPIFLISALGAVFGGEYWKQSEHQRNGRKLRVFYGLLTLGLALLVVARNGFCFLLGWEFMALSCFFAMTAEDDKADVREAGWIYFASTHVSTLLLFAFFALYYVTRGSLTLDPFSRPLGGIEGGEPALGGNEGGEPGGVTPGAANALFLLALAAFGLKAGLFPLHFWLPSAHANAPSHVSALMSGVLIKMGVYGMLRIIWLFPEVPLWWGGCLLALGCISGVLGVAFAIEQHDLKRLLAYHSIENIGIIFMGMGLAAAGRALGRTDWVVLGLGGAVLHTWNHGLFKALLFLAAGSVIHTAHTREIDRLGGLSKPMPLTAVFFLVGAVSICGLPPLNGFVSELLIYLGLFRAGCAGDGAAWGLAAFAIPVLALIGGLALACFVKVYGAVFLGTPRTPDAEKVHEAGSAMTAPMAILAGACVLIGLVPSAVAPLLDVVARSWDPASQSPGHSLSAAAPLGWLSITGAATLGLLCLGGLVFLRRAPAPARGPAGVFHGAESIGTWDCGYARPSPSMQYTASSFAEMVVRLFAWVLAPRTRAASLKSPFPARAAFHSHVPDAVLDRMILPVFGILAWACSWFRLLQRGKMTAYVLYIFITLLVLLLWK